MLETYQVSERQRSITKKFFIEAFVDWWTGCPQVRGSRGSAPGCAKDGTQYLARVCTKPRIGAGNPKKKRAEGEFFRSLLKIKLLDQGLRMACPFGGAAGIRGLSRLALRSFGGTWRGAVGRECQRLFVKHGLPPGDDGVLRARLSGGR